MCQSMSRKYMRYVFKSQLILRAWDNIQVDEENKYSPLSTQMMVWYISSRQATYIV